MQQIIYQNRIPKDFFLTKGFGESQYSQKTGSFFLALKAANIENYNIISCSAFLSKESTEILKKDLVLGSELKTIMAVCHGVKGQTIGAGIGFGWLHHKETDEKLCGIVTDFTGNVSKEIIKKRLLANLSEIYLNSFHDLYLLKNIKLVSITNEVSQKFGSCLAAICFVNHIYISV